MNKMNKIKKLAALALACMTIVGAVTPTASAYTVKPEIPVSKTQNRSYNFRTDYTLTGNYADDIISVAQAQLGLTTKEAGYSEDWCANFVADCSRLTGMPESIIPYNYSLIAGCRFFYRYILDYCNAKVITDVNDVMAGDLVFYYCPKSDFYLHVAIVENSNYYLEGNITTAKGREEVIRSDLGYNFGCYIHNSRVDNTESGHVQRFYVRPDYGQPPTNFYTDPDPLNYSPPTRELSYKDPIPSCGFDVCWVQCVLKRAGYTDTVNGVFDEKTRDAVSRYQWNNNLYSDGVVRDETIRSLKATYNYVFKPQFHSFTTSEKHHLNDNITFNIDANNYDTIKLVIKDNNDNIVYGKNKFDPSTAIPASLFDKGTYTANCVLKNRYGNSEIRTITLTVIDPPPGISNLTTSSDDNTPVKLTWNQTENTDVYDLIINDSYGNTYFELNDTTSLEHTIYLREGAYTAYIVAKNETVSTRGETNSFTVAAPKSAPLDDDFYAMLYYGDNCVKASDSLKLSEKGNLASQKWHFIRNSDNTYNIINCKTGNAICVGTHDTIYLSPVAKTVLQKWVPVYTNNEYLFVSAFDKSKILKFTDDGAIAGHSQNCNDEAITIKPIDTPHLFTLTEIVLPTETDGYAAYTCSITNETKTKFIPHHTPEITDTPDTPDTPDVPETNDIPDNASRLIGDTNNDGRISNSDALLLLRSVLGLYKLDEISCILHDSNSDDKISAVDSMKILQYVIGIESDSSVGKSVTIR